MLSLLVFTTCACTLVVGGLSAVGDFVPPALSQRLHLPETSLRGWRRWHLLTLVFLFPLLGHLVDGWSVQTTLFAGFLTAALGLAWLGVAKTSRAALLAMLLLGAAEACILVPTIVLLRAAFQFEIPHLRGSGVEAMNLGFAGIALGWLCGPALVRKALTRLGPSNGFLLLALSCLVPAALVAILRREDLPDRTTPLGLEALADDVRWWLVLSLGFFYFPLEHLVQAWRPRYVQQAGSAGRLLTPGFWIALLAMRLVAGWFVWDGFEAWGLACFALAFAVVVGNLASAYAPAGSTWGLWLVGATLGPLLPTLLALLPNLFPKNVAGTAGLIFGMGALSGLVVQPILERFTERNPLPAPMRFNMMLALAWGGLGLVLALMGSMSQM